MDLKVFVQICQIQIYMETWAHGAIQLPLLCRTYNFGAKGSSKGQYYKRFLAPIRLSSSQIDWATEDLTYLEKSR